MAIRVEKSGPVTTVIHDRPEARNAVDPSAAEALYNAFQQFDADEQARVAVFWGAGGNFCAGWDLKYGASLDLEGSPLAELDFPSDDTADLPRGPMGPSRLALSKPVIGAISGAAVAGGMELALWCDLRVMEQDAYMGVYCRRWGVPLADGGTVRLPRLVGLGRALEIILTGRTVSAEECMRIGACERLVPCGEARREAEAMAREIARFPPECVRADRQSVYQQCGLDLQAALKQEWQRAMPVLRAEGIKGAQRFAAGRGRHGDFTAI